MINFVKPGREILITSVLVSALSGGACVNLTPDSVMPVGKINRISSAMVADPNAPIKSTIRTAQSGEMLYSPALEHEFVLVLQDTPEVDGEFGNSFQDRKLEAQPGQKYFPALTFGEVRSIAACSFDSPVLAIPRLAPSNQGYIKMCFEIADLPVDFDVDTLDLDRTDWVSSKLYVVVPPNGLASGTSFQAMSRWDPHVSYNTVSPVRFTRQRAEAVTGEGARTAGLRFVVSPTGPQLETAFMAGNEPRKTTKDPVEIDAAKGFPQTLEFDSANVEVLALTDGVLAYRIISANPAQRVILDLN